MSGSFKILIQINKGSEPDGLDAKMRNLISQNED